MLRNVNKRTPVALQIVRQLKDNYFIVQIILFSVSLDWQLWS